MKSLQELRIKYICFAGPGVSFKFQCTCICLLYFEHKAMKQGSLLQFCLSLKMAFCKWIYRALIRPPLSPRRDSGLRGALLGSLECWKSVFPEGKFLGGWGRSSDRQGR